MYILHVYFHAQADTEEQLSLPSGKCLGYTWFSPSPSSFRHHHLRLCLTSLTPLEWTKPFSLDSVGAGITSLQVPFGGSSTACAHVRVASAGGMQRKVVKLVLMTTCIQRPLYSKTIQSFYSPLRDHLYYKGHYLWGPHVVA